MKFNDLTPKQQEILSIVARAPRGHVSFEDLAFFAGTTPQAAGRVSHTLSGLGLVTVQRFVGPYEVWPTDKGAALVKETDGLL